MSKTDQAECLVRPEQSHTTNALESQVLADSVTRSRTATEDLEEKHNPRTLKQDDAKGNCSQIATINNPEQTITSPNKHSHSKNNTNKRLRFGPSQRNKSGPRAKNGSYHNYYKRRYNGIHGDDRLPIIRDTVKLQGKNITLLDVGCNDGTVTIEMASLDSCVEAVGIDIDPNLVGSARKNLQAFAEKEAKNTQAQLQDLGIQGSVPNLNDTLPLSLRHSLQLMKEALGKGIENGVMHGRPVSLSKIPHNVTFRREDFAQKAMTRTSQEVGKYDVVLCLSVTKWVHFAGGDEALKRFFRRLHACLKPGGLLILEPQPQKSYKSAIRKGLGKKDVNGERKLKPPKFAEYLTKTVGFGKMRMLRDVRHRGQAFNRPIMSFYKHHMSSPSAFGMALSRHADVFLGVLPSDDDGDGRHHQEQGDAVETRNGPVEPDVVMRDVVVDDNEIGDAAQDATEEGENADNAKNSHADDDDDVAGQDIQDIVQKQQEQEPLPSTLVGPNGAEANVPEVETNAKVECLLAHESKTSSPKMASNQTAILSSARSKRSTHQEIEGINPQSPKRGRHDREGTGQTSLEGPSIAEGNGSEIKTKRDDSQLARDAERSSGNTTRSQVVVLRASGLKRRSTSEGVEGIKPQSTKRGKHDTEERQGQTPLTGECMGEGNGSEIETKVVEASSENISESEGVVLPSSGSERRNSDKEAEGIPQGRKRHKSDKDAIQFEPRSPPHESIE